MDRFKATRKASTKFTTDHAALVAKSVGRVVTRATIGHWYMEAEDYS